MDGWMRTDGADGWMMRADERIDGCGRTDRWMDGADGRMDADGWMDADGRMDGCGRTNGWMRTDGWSGRTDGADGGTDGWMDRRTDGRTDGGDVQTDKRRIRGWTGRWIYGRTDRIMSRRRQTTKHTNKNMDN